MAQQDDPMQLGAVLAFAMRQARENDGYGIDQIDRALAVALLAEATNRAALVTAAGSGQAPARDAVAEIFGVVLEDIRLEAQRIMRRGLH